MSASAGVGANASTTAGASAGLGADANTAASANASANASTAASANASTAANLAALTSRYGSAACAVAFTLLASLGCGSAPPAPTDATSDVDRDGELDDAAPDAREPSPADEAISQVCACLLGSAGDYVLEAETELGAVPAELPEGSGMVTSRFADDVFWAHNDSGHAAELFAIDRRGSLLARVAFPSLENRDWEDLAGGPCAPGEPRECLYIGDVGDNLSRYPSVRVHRWREPDPREAPAEVGADAVETLELVFPDGARDTEALVVDDDARVWLLTKRPPVGRFRVYSALFEPGATTTLTFHLEVPLSRVSMRASGSMFTAADLEPRCGALLGRFYGGAFLARVDPADLATSLDTATLHPIPTGAELQGEAIAWTADGYWHFAEGNAAPIHRFRCVPRR